MESNRFVLMVKMQNIKLFFITFCLMLIALDEVFAQNTLQEKQVMVSMRKIGHEFLLNMGDSVSRVLPIEKEDGRFKISFETELEFMPEMLVSTITEVLKEGNSADNYILEVESCDSNKVVYSYEVDPLRKDAVIACGTRFLPLDCYYVYLTFVPDSYGNASLFATPPQTAKDLNQPTKGNKPKAPYLIILGLFFIGIFVYLLMSKRKKPELDSNLISIGAYQFNKITSELLYENQKMELTSKEADLLILLYNTMNTTVEREFILNKVWGDEGDYIGRTLDVFISKLRKKLEADSSIKIVNIRGVGYKLVMDK